MNGDPGLVAEATRIKVDVLAVAGEELQTAIEALHRTPQVVLAKARAAIMGR
jgi:uncharacterized protein with ACT and thioredoxin-like domain